MINLKRKINKWKQWSACLATANKKTQRPKKEKRKKRKKKVYLKRVFYKLSVQKDSFLTAIEFTLGLKH